MLFAICTVAAAPMRKEPSHRTEMTSQVLFGEIVSILAEKEEWLHIACVYDGYEGWVTNHLLTPIETEIATAPVCFVAAGLLNELNGDNQLFQLPMGSSLTGFNEETGTLWTDSYMYKGTYRNITTLPTRTLFQTLIQPWLNAPYLWGGKTFMGVDCSGFVQTVFKVLGVPLLRDAYQQAEQGTVVPDLTVTKEGDVAFFKSESGKITHVGIVMAHNQIIHASGKVRIDTLTSEGIVTSAGRQTHHLHSIKRVIAFGDAGL